jgi:hypothetical protein
MRPLPPDMPAAAPDAREPSAACRARRWLRTWWVPDDAELGDRGTHLMYLVFLTIAILGPSLLTFDPTVGEQVQIGSMAVPSTCPSQALFHVQCPGCQLTRSFILITHGRLRDAIRFHRMGIPLYLFFAGQAVLRVYGLKRGDRPFPRWLLQSHHYLALAMIVLLILNWGAGFIVGSNGS